MHGYGVACFTAKCRRRAAAPPLAFYILHVPSSPLSYPHPALLRHPLPLFSVSLCLPFPRRAACRVARYLTRVFFSYPPCVHISIVHSPPLRVSSDARRVAFPCYSPACSSTLSLSLSLLSLSQRENPPDYIVCFLSTATSRILVLTLTLTLTLTRTRISGPL